MNVKLTTAKSIVKATVCLHNWLMKVDARTYCPPELVDSETEDTLLPGGWRAEDNGEQGAMRALNFNERNARTMHAVDVRNTFREYFNAEGTVPWQLQMLNAH